MAKEFFKHIGFKSATRELIAKCESIIDDYLSQGLRLTLRQLYYQLVIANEITNEEKSYKTLGKVVSDARLNGDLDWEAIEDRVRQPKMSSEFEDLADLVDVALDAYRLPRWANQQAYVELWVEKDALAGVLAPIASEFHIVLMINRGYSSQSAMYESAKRFKKYQEDKDLYLFYLGDHDPSGEDMVRDVRDRLWLFGAPTLKVEKLALTMTQVKQYNPPPNPAKLSDTRAAAYVDKHGDSSWEVDALPPNVLVSIIRTALDKVVDKEAMDKIKRQEKEDKKRLKEAVKSLMKE